MDTTLQVTRSPQESPIGERINRIGQALSESIRAVLHSTPGVPSTPQQLVQTYGMHRVFSQRLVNAIGRVDPIATVHQIPGPEPLRRLLKAAKRKGVSNDVLRDAESAIRSFDELIRNVAGDRSGLDAIVSTWLPDARARIENVAKQSMYRGARQIKGIAADIDFITLMMHPSDDDKERLNFAVLRGYLGLHCVRPGAALKLRMVSHASHPGAVPVTLAGQPMRDSASDFVLESFCPKGDLGIEYERIDQQIVHVLRWDDSIGINAARDIVMAERWLHGPRLVAIPEDTAPKTGMTHRIAVPSRTCVCDILLHERAYPGWEPNVCVLECGELGAPDPNDSWRELDVLDTAESIQPMGQGVSRFRAEQIPRYTEMLAYACEQTGWDPQAFRGFRTRIDYPIFNSLIQFAFDVPEADSE